MGKNIEINDNTYGYDRYILGRDLCPKNCLRYIVPIIIEEEEWENVLKYVKTDKVHIILKHDYEIISSYINKLTAKFSHITIGYVVQSALPIYRTVIIDHRRLIVFHIDNFIQVLARNHSSISELVVKENMDSVINWSRFHVSDDNNFINYVDITEVFTNLVTFTVDLDYYFLRNIGYNMEKDICEMLYAVLSLKVENVNLIGDVSNDLKHRNSLIHKINHYMTGHTAWMPKDCNVTIRRLQFPIYPVLLARFKLLLPSCIEYTIFSGGLLIDYLDGSINDFYSDPESENVTINIIIDMLTNTSYLPRNNGIRYTYI
jgi:hypothetical protein